MKVLLCSGGLRVEPRVRAFVTEVRAFLGGVSKVLFVPYALADHDAYVRTIVERGLHAGYELDGIHKYPDARLAVRSAQAIYMGGGNTFRLLSDLYRFDLLDVIRERVRAGMPYVGISAGTNVACPTIKTTNDMPITHPPSLNALGLVPFQVNPHYFSGATYRKEGDAYVEHFGETRDDRLREFHELNDMPVIGLWEGGMLRVVDGKVELLATPARIFRKGQAAVDVAPGAIML